MDVIFDPNRQKAPGNGGAAAAAAAADVIKDGDAKTFMQDVVEASRQVPVLVDFWATWCGPCKTLTPTIEKVVRAAGGRVRLVKVDIDKNRALVQQLMQFGLPLQSVPTVAAFWQGQIADLFQGALPEGEVKKFVEGLLKLAGGQMPSADLLGEAKAAAAEGDHQGALELYGALAQGEPENAEALAGVARSLMALGQEEQARQVVETAPAKLRDHAGDRFRPQRAGTRRRGAARPLQARRVREAARRGCRRPRGAHRPRRGAERGGRARRGRGRAPGGDPPRPRLERRGGAQAVAEILRGLGLRRSGDPGGAAQAFLLAVPLNAPRSAGQGSGGRQAWRRSIQPSRICRPRSRCSR